jgi:predicted outer membrane repeat protein
VSGLFSVPAWLWPVLICALSTSVYANIITVTNTHDSGPGSLRQALADANDGDTINFAVTGTIGLTIGELLVAKDLMISGPGAQKLAVDGHGKTRVFHVASGKTVTISGLTITNGNGVPGGTGGGIHNDHASLMLNNCTLSSNSANIGGGVYNNGERSGNAFLSINNCIFKENSAGNSGGGIFNNGEMGGSATVGVNNSTFNGNSASSDGGGIFNDGGFSGTAYLEIALTTVSGNSANGNGGGIANDGSTTGSADLQIVNSTVLGNSATSGGGVHNHGQQFGKSMLEVINSTVTGNNSDAGAGVYNLGEGAILSIASSTINANSAATYGGAIYSDSLTVAAQNSTISGNSAGSSLGDSGGGIINYNATLTITNTTLSGNSAYYAGAIHNSAATLSVGNTVVKAGALGVNIVNTGTGASQGYNVCSDDGGGYLTGPGDQINTDPLLGPLQDNGGTTLTHALLPGSPAINTGDPKFTPPPGQDQRGYPRVVSGRIDIGSFEVQATDTPSPTPTPTPTSCSVSSAICGRIVSTQPTDFVVNVSCPVDPATLQCSEFTVNGTPATACTLTNGNTTITFHFNTTPVVQGLNTMHIAAGGFSCCKRPVLEFTCTFRYELPRSSPTPRPRPTPAPRP